MKPALGGLGGKTKLPLQKEAALRKAYINDHERTRQYAQTELGLKMGYCSNSIVTSKYTVYNFVPKNLLEQFRRVSNIYFLIISAIQLFTRLSPTSRYTTLIPLLIVVGVTMVKEAIEDRARHEADKRVNFSSCHRINQAKPEYEEVSLQDLRVGDVIVLHDGDHVPADVVILASSDPQGLCSVETANLDGESNLKIKTSATVSVFMDTKPEDLCKIRGCVHYGQPNGDFYRFDATVVIDMLTGEKAEFPLAIQNFISRGCKLMNTDWVIAVAVYTGADTKQTLNSRDVPSKKSRMDRILDQCNLLIFFALLLLCCLTTVLSSKFFQGGLQVMGLTKDVKKSWWYLDLKSEDFDAVSMFVTFLVLYNYLVPISLYLTVEVVKFLQVRAIEKDTLMIDPETKQGAIARTSNLNEDLGQIKYILSDKTGTLTQNKMAFKGCSVGGIIYGSQDAPAGEISQSKASSSCDDVTSPRRAPTPGKEGATEEQVKAPRSGLRSENNKSQGRDNYDLPSPAGLSGRSAKHAVVPIVLPVKQNPSPGEGTEEKRLSADSGQGERAETSRTKKRRSSTYPLSAGFSDPMLIQHLTSDHSNQYLLQEFLRCAVICHTVSPEATDGDEVIYRATSPDEQALVMAARNLGYKLISTKGGRITVSVFGELETWEVLGVNEFDSARKCMSVVVRDSKGKVVVYCKGADAVMLERSRDKSVGSPSRCFGEGSRQKESGRVLLAKSAPVDLSPGSVSRYATTESTENVEKSEVLDYTATPDSPVPPLALKGRGAMGSKQSQNQVLVGHLKKFASQGLRTLVFGRKEMSEEEFRCWYSEFQMANKSIMRRDEEKLAIARKLESNLEILGASAIEDKLQDGVPGTVSRLLKAGIKIWMLTGDKEETAVNIGHSASLLDQSMKMLPINGPKPSNCIEQLKYAFKHCKRNRDGDSKNNALAPKHAVVVTGEAIKMISESREQIKYGVQELELFMVLRYVLLNCTSVIGCRLTPMQKASLVTLLKEEERGTTLAVGDGANDVHMIQEAHVGVGVIGNEGRQAVNAADFAVPDFKCLSQLLLYHGRWNYRRVAMVILYSFYKNLCLVSSLFLFVLRNGMSGAALFESYMMMGWNVLYTFFPVLVLGVTDKDLSEEAVMAYPAIYERGQLDREFGWEKLLQWVSNGMLHATINYLGHTIIFYGRFGITSSEGVSDGLDIMGSSIYILLVVIVNLKMALTMQPLKHWTAYHYISIGGSILLIFAFVVIYSVLYQALPVMNLGAEYNSVGTTLLTRPNFWLVLVLLPSCCILADIAITFLHRSIFPSAYVLLRSLDQLGPEYAQAFAAQRGNLSCEESLDATVVDPSTNVTDANSANKLTDPLLDRLKRVVTEEEAKKDEVQRYFLDLYGLLRAQERKIARTIGMDDIFELAEERRVAHEEAVDTKLHPLTLEFAGTARRYLETLYNRQFLKREVSRLRVLIIFTIIALPFYTVWEYRFDNQKTFPVRLTYLACAIFSLGVTYSKFFFKYYHTIVFVVFLIITLANTSSIAINGQFAITLLPTVMFSVIRMRFLDAVLLVLTDTIFYSLVMYMYYANDAETKALHMMTFFLISVIFSACFAGYGSYNLQGLPLHRPHRYLLFFLTLELCSFGDIPQSSITPCTVAMRRDFLQQRTLDIEQKRSQDILDNIYPSHVTKRVQAGETTIFDEEPNVTVIFCNICEFEELTSMMGPDQLVSVLDMVYSMFDLLCLKHGVHKMETVGSIYMACAGLRNFKSDDPALSAAATAYDMIRYAAEVGISLQIGLHTGRVVSGLVGQKKQQFSLFGDTVNTASRMQSTGLPGKCQISQSTMKALQGAFTLTERRVTPKGKGEMIVYILGNPVTERARAAIEGLALKARKPSENKRYSIVQGQNTSDVINLSATIGRRNTFWGSENRVLPFSSESAAATASQLQANLVQKRRKNFMRRATELWIRLSQNDTLNEKINVFTLRFRNRATEEWFQAQRHSHYINSSYMCIAFAIVFVMLGLPRDHYGYASYFGGDLDDLTTSVALLMIGFKLFYTLFALAVMMWIYRRRHDITLNNFHILLSITILLCVCALTTGHYCAGYQVVQTCPEMRKIYRYANDSQIVCIHEVTGVRFERTKEMMISTISADLKMMLDSAAIDLMLVMFLVSNGGAFGHWRSILLNLFLCACMLSFQFWLAGHSEGVFRLGTFFMGTTVVVNTIASRAVEFFTRRKLWLLQQTKHETDKADRLLYQMLPEAVVTALKDGDTVCEEHHNVGILYSDIKGFTSIASRAEPEQVVSMLDKVFTAFDQAVEKNGVFKFQTIGDAYVILSGLPYQDKAISAEPLRDQLSQARGSVVMEKDFLHQLASRRGATQKVLPTDGACPSPSTPTSPSGGRKRSNASVNQRKLSLVKSGSNNNGTSATRRHQRRRSSSAGRTSYFDPTTAIVKNSEAHAKHMQSLIAMAQDMLRETAKVNDPISGEPLQIRIGIHTGNIIGAVIGTKNLRYDMWSPDALIAHEFESNGVPNRICVSAAVRECFQNDIEMSAKFVPYKVIDTHSMGKIQAYLYDDKIKPAAALIESIRHSKRSISVSTNGAQHPEMCGHSDRQSQFTI